MTRRGALPEVHSHSPKYEHYWRDWTEESAPVIAPAQTRKEAGSPANPHLAGADRPFSTTAL
ncbi:hypothetical protein EMIT0P43_110059 [Pseudomonas jessenii]